MSNQFPCKECLIKMICVNTCEHATFKKSQEMLLIMLVNIAEQNSKKLMFGVMVAMNIIE